MPAPIRDAMITFDEALSGIAWAALSADTKRVLAEVEEEAHKAGMKEALKELYRSFGRCTVQDAIVAHAVFLEEHYPELLRHRKIYDDDTTKRLTRASRDLRRVADEIDDYQEDLESELASGRKKIHAVMSPRGFGHFLPGGIQYTAPSVALWADNVLDLFIPEWSDLRDFDLYCKEYDEDESWITEARFEARLYALSTLIHRAMDTKIPKTSERIPRVGGRIETPGLRLKMKNSHNPSGALKMNISGFIDFMQWQFSRVAKNATRQLLAKGPDREILKKWNPKFGFPYKALDAYRRPLSDSLDLMIASLVIGLCDDSFADILRNASSPDCVIGQALKAFGPNLVAEISESDLRSILRLSIDKMLEKARPS